MLDFCVILVIVIFAWWGYKKGLVQSVFALGSYIISLALAWMLYPIAAGVLNGTALHSTIAGAITADIQLPEMLSGLVDSTAGGIATLMVNIIAMVLVFVLSKLLIVVIGKMLDIFAKLPVIKQFNGIGGLIAGFLQGALICYIIFAVLVLFVPGNDMLQAQVDKSYIAMPMYYDNFILNFFK